MGKLHPVLIVGRKNSGKTAYLKFLIEKMKQRGLTVGGFISPGAFSGGDKQSYAIQDIRSGETWLLASKNPDVSRPLAFGAYHFDPSAFAQGDRILRRNLDADAIVLDEFGPLERDGKGFREALDFLLMNYRGLLFIAVRPSLAERLHHILSSASR